MTCSRFEQCPDRVRTSAAIRRCLCCRTARGHCESCESALRGPGASAGMITNTNKPCVGMSAHRNHHHPEWPSRERPGIIMIAALPAALRSRLHGSRTAVVNVAFAWTGESVHETASKRACVSAQEREHARASTIA